MEEQDDDFIHLNHEIRAVNQNKPSTSSARHLLGYEVVNQEAPFLNQEQEQRWRFVNNNMIQNFNLGEIDEQLEFEMVILKD